MGWAKNEDGTEVGDRYLASNRSDGKIVKKGKLEDHLRVYFCWWIFNYVLLGVKEKDMEKLC